MGKLWWAWARHPAVSFLSLTLTPPPTHWANSQGSRGTGQGCCFSSDRLSLSFPIEWLGVICLQRDQPAGYLPTLRGTPAQQRPFPGPSPSAKHSADISFFSSYRVPPRWLRKRWLRRREVVCPTQSHSVRGRVGLEFTASQSDHCRRTWYGGLDIKPGPA